jgi:hypothetical protein
MSGRGSLANQVPLGFEFGGERRVAGEAQNLELAVGALAASTLRRRWLSYSPPRTTRMIGAP